MKGRSLKETPSPLMSPLTSGVKGRPLCSRHINPRLMSYGSSVKPERMKVWSREKKLGPHARSSSPKPPRSFGPKAPTFDSSNPSVGVQQEYEELS